MVLMTARFRARQITLAQAQLWYAEYSGRAACRQFSVGANNTQVAPYDVPFIGRNDPAGFPAVEGATEVGLQEFESAWERFAQPRLHGLSIGEMVSVPTAVLQYRRIALTEEFSEFGPGYWYAEFADDITRRQFDVYADQTRVAPYDMGLSELGPDEGGEAPGIVNEPITHATFEAAWMEFALPRLRQLAGADQ